MKKLTVAGAIDIFLIPLILMTILFVGAAGFAYWAYTGRQDYKNNVDAKIDDAVEAANKETVLAKDNEFAEKEKLPLQDYQGPAAYNSIVVKYPKTWSAYVSERGSGNAPVDAYFHPVFVPASSQSVAYALRVQLVDNNYATELKKYDQAVKQGKLRATAYSPARVQSVAGTRLDGEISQNKKGAIILLPVRDKTLRVWTEAPQFVGDLNDIILPNYSFEP